jgi:hypothetical protein
MDPDKTENKKTNNMSESLRIQKTLLRFDDGLGNTLDVKKLGLELKLEDENAAPVILTGIKNPVNLYDAANKQYVDEGAGFSFLASVRCATASTFTTLPVAGDIVDGVVLAVDELYLMKDFSPSDPTTGAIENGVYRVLLNSPFVERSGLMPAESIAHGDYVSVAEGVENAGSGYFCISPIGTDEVSVDPLKFEPLIENLQLDNITLERLSIGVVQVKDNGVDSVKLATNAVTTTKILDDAVTTVKILDGSVTNAKLLNESISVTPGTGLNGGGIGTLGASTAALNVNNEFVRYDATPSNGTYELLLHESTAPDTATSFDGLEYDSTNSILFTPEMKVTSDENLKRDIQDLEDGPEKLAALRPVTFRWKRLDEEKYEGPKVHGFIAQELQAVMPDAVSRNSRGTLAMSAIEIIPVLVAAVQSLEKRLADLEGN